VTLPRGHRTSVLVDQATLHERAAEVLMVVVDLDRAAWRTAAAARPVDADQLTGDLRLACWSLSTILRTRPWEGVEVSELLARRWALRWLAETARAAAERLTLPAAGRQLLDAADAAERLITDAGAHLRRVHPAEVRRAHRRAQARVTTVLEQTVPAWRVEVLRGARLGTGAAGGEALPAAGGHRIFDIHLARRADQDAEHICRRLAQLVNGRLDQVDPADEEGYRVALAWRLDDLGRLDEGDLVQVTSPTGRIEVWLCTRQAAAGWWLLDVIDGDRDDAPTDAELVLEVG